VKWLLPRNDVAEVVVAIVAPIIAALIRSAAGWHQLEQAWGNFIPRDSQVALGVAIVLLMLLEGITAMLTFADDEPGSAWITPAILYVAYLVTITYAQRRPDQRQSGD
jgi:hypothetical protein